MPEWVQKLFVAFVRYFGRLLALLGLIIAVVEVLGGILFPSIQVVEIAIVLFGAVIGVAGYITDRGLTAWYKNCQTRVKNSAAVHLDNGSPKTSAELFSLVGKEHPICTTLLGTMFDTWMIDNGVATMTAKGYVRSIRAPDKTET